MAYDANVECFRDIYRDAFGCRPSAGQYARFGALSVEEQCAELDRLGEIADAEAEREREMQAAAAVRFESRVSDLIAIGAGNRETAIRWIGDAEQAYNGPDFLDLGYLEYLCGLRYGYLENRAA